MSNQIYIPRTNPVNFYEVIPVSLPQYHTRKFDDYPFKDTIKDWEHPACYKQKFQTNDTCNLQFIANFTPIQIDLTDRYGRVYRTQTATLKLQNEQMLTFWAQEISMSFAGLAEGIYFFRLMYAGLELMISEPIDLGVYWPNTVLYQYSNGSPNRRFHNDVIFETNIVFNFRVEGNIGRLVPGSLEQYYNDQKLNHYLLNSRTFNKFNHNVGGNHGAPDWVFDKMNLIWSCSNVQIDGVFYAKVAEGDYDFTEEEFYPLRSVNMIIQEGLNRASKIVNPDLNQDLRLTVLYNIRTAAIFGNMAPQNDTIVITDSE